MTTKDVFEESSRTGRPLPKFVQITGASDHDNALLYALDDRGRVYELRVRGANDAVYWSRVPSHPEVEPQEQPPARKRKLT